MIDKTKRIYIFNRDGWRCSVCGKQVTFTTGQIAHRIAKTKTNLEKYGEEIIDNPANLRLTCSLNCNSAVLIDNKPAEKEYLIKAIKLILRIRKNKKYEP